MTNQKNDLGVRYGNRVMQVAYCAGFEDGKKEAQVLVDELVEGLKWYAAGMPFRDDFGNETELAIKLVAKAKKLRGEK